MVGRALAIVVVGCTIAHANTALERARAEIQAVRYDAALPLLADALKTGANEPAAVAEIYLLSAIAASVVGDRTAAEDHYARWLALVPAAKLPAEVSPKLRGPFDAARERMKARGALAIAARRANGRISIEVASDPLGMVRTVGVRDSRGAIRSVQIVDGSAELAGGAGYAVALDEHGNVLAIATPSVEPVTSPIGDEPQREPDVALIKRPWLWAIPAGVFVGVGVGFGVAARNSDRDLDDLLASGDGFFDDAIRVRDRRDRQALVANIAFAAGGACAVTAVVMYIVGKRRATIVPASGGVTGVGVLATW